MAIKIPLSKVAEVLKSGKNAGKDADTNISILILVEKDAPSQLIEAVREAFVAERLGAAVRVSELTTTLPKGSLDAAVLVLADASDTAADAICSLIDRGVRVAVVCESSLSAPDIHLDEHQSELYSLIAGSDAHLVLDKLAKWLISSNKHLAFAANFPFCREAEVESLVTKCAAENAAVGAVQLIPGADLPIMTSNQAKLALDIAAAYGEELSPERALELVAVVGAGFGYRAIARQLVGLIPGVGFALKAGVGYAGTVATGKAIQARFELKESAQESSFEIPGDEENLPTKIISALNKLTGTSSQGAPSSALEVRVEKIDGQSDAD